MAAGKVCTGFSKPYVALYSASGTTVSYSDGQLLARGVDVSIEVETSDDNNFYADNVLAESAPRHFMSGTISLTVDGLLAAAESLIMGLPDADSDGWIGYGEDQEIPYVGIGFIARYMSDGVETFKAVVLPKCQFNEIATSAATQEEDIDWQTQELSASIYRSDDSNNNWKFVHPTEFTTEALALAELQTKLDIS